MHVLNNTLVISLDDDETQATLEALQQWRGPWPDNELSAQDQQHHDRLVAAGAQVAEAIRDHLQREESKERAYWTNLHHAAGMSGRNH